MASSSSSSSTSTTRAARYTTRKPSPASPLQDDELLIRILGRVSSLHGVVMSSQVSRRWQRCAEDRAVWEPWWAKVWESNDMKWILPTLLQSLSLPHPFSRSKKTFSALWQSVLGQPRRTIGILGQEANLHHALQVSNARIVHRTTAVLPIGGNATRRASDIVATTIGSSEGGGAGGAGGGGGGGFGIGVGGGSSNSSSTSSNYHTRGVQQQQQQKNKNVSSAFGGVVVGAEDNDDDDDDNDNDDADLDDHHRHPITTTTGGSGFGSSSSAAAAAAAPPASSVVVGFNVTPLSTVTSSSSSSSSSNTHPTPSIAASNAAAEALSPIRAALAAATTSTQQQQQQQLHTTAAAAAVAATNKPPTPHITPQSSFSTCGGGHLGYITCEVLWVVCCDKIKPTGARLIMSTDVENMCHLLSSRGVRCVVALHDPRIVHNCFKQLGLALETPPSPFLDIPVYLVPPSAWRGLADVEDEAWADILTDTERLESLERAFGFVPARVGNSENTGRRVRAHVAGDPASSYQPKTFPQLTVWVGGASPHAGCAFKHGRAYDRFEHAGYLLAEAGWCTVKSDSASAAANMMMLLSSSPSSSSGIIATPATDKERCRLALAYVTEVMFPHCHVDAPPPPPPVEKVKFGDRVKNVAKSLVGAKAQSSGGGGGGGGVAAAQAAISDAIRPPMVEVEDAGHGVSRVRVRVWLKVPHVMDKSFMRQQELVFGSSYIRVTCDFVGSPPKLSVVTDLSLKGVEFGSAVGKLAEVTNPSVRYEQKKRFALDAPKVLRRELEVEPMALSLPSLSLEERPSSHSIDFQRQRAWSFAGVPAPRQQVGSRSAAGSVGHGFAVAADAVIAPIREEAIMQEDVGYDEDGNEENQVPGPLLQQLESLSFNATTNR